MPPSLALLEVLNRCVGTALCIGCCRHHDVAGYCSTYCVSSHRGIGSRLYSLLRDSVRFREPSGVRAADRSSISRAPSVPLAPRVCTAARVMVVSFASCCHPESMCSFPQVFHHKSYWSSNHLGHSGGAHPDCSIRCRALSNPHQRHAVPYR